MRTSEKRLENLQFLSLLASHLNSRGVFYKIFGGMVVVTYNTDRITTDADVAIGLSVENVNNFILALVDMNFGTYADMYYQVWGNEGQKYMESTCHLESTNPQFEGVHLDLMFNIGMHSYDTLQSCVVDVQGVPVSMVTPYDVIRMKANIFPRPRQKDIDDIIFLADMLGLDPTTGQSINKERGEKRGSKRSIKDWFTGRNPK